MATTTATTAPMTTTPVSPTFEEHALSLLPGETLRGRKAGKGASKYILEMKAKASTGDLQAALKLGWSVDRLCNIINKNKAANSGLKKQQADDKHDDALASELDPELLATIQKRKRDQCRIQEKRRIRLKERAHSGEVKAMKLLKWSDKKIARVQEEIENGVMVKLEDDEELDGSIKFANAKSIDHAGGSYQDRHDSVFDFVKLSGDDDSNVSIKGANVFDNGAEPLPDSRTDASDHANLSGPSNTALPFPEMAGPVLSSIDSAVLQNEHAHWHQIIMQAQRRMFELEVMLGLHPAMVPWA